MKKVLIFSLAYYPRFVSGAEVAIKEITDRISPEDIEFHLITLRFDSNLPKVERVGNVTVHRIGFARPNPTFEELKKMPLHINKPLFQFLAAWKAFTLHRTHRFDATWAMMAHAAGVPAAIFKIFHPRVPYILTLQEGDPIEHIERTMHPVWPLFTRAFTKADVVQAISGYLAQWARDRHFEGPLEVVPNGASLTSSQDYPEAELAELRQSLNMKEDEVFLVSVGRLSHQKAQDIVIRALPLLPSNIRYIMVGEGPDKEMLESLARELGVADRITFTGKVDRTMTAKYRKISAAFVMPSRSEGQGISFLSTLASGTPLVTTQEGGIADFLFDAKRNPEQPTTGWAVDKDNPQQIADAVTYILSHPDEVKAVTDNARALAIEKYDWENIAKNMRTNVFGRALGDSLHS